MFTKIKEIHCIIIYYMYSIYVVAKLLGLGYEMVWSWVRNCIPGRCIPILAVLLGLTMLTGFWWCYIVTI